MKVIKDFDIESLLDLLRSFSYTKEVEGETVTCNVELFSHAQTPIATKFFLQCHGDRIADFILEQYGEEYITATELSDMIKTVCVPRWKQFYEMWKADYNPIWNVDGTEKRVIVTEFGKVIEHEKDTTVTDEQKTDGKNNVTHGLTVTDEQKTDGKNNVTHGLKVTDEQKTDGKNNVTHGLKVTDEQKTDGKNNITHGLVDTITEPTTTGKVAAFDSADFVNASQTSATQHSDTQSGTTNTAISMGTIEHANSGTTNTAISMGTIEHANSGTTNTAISMGTIEHASSGTTNTAISMGTIEHTSSGTDTDTESGDETVTDTYTRHGNIGITMSSQLLRDNENFWSQYSFFEHWYDDIAGQISLPMWG